MSKHSFYQWLQNEVVSEKYVLLTLYEQIDKIRYVTAPQVEQEYMDKIGNFEQTVIKEEMECEILMKKQELIQIAINQNKPIDEAAIDAELHEFRQALFNEAKGTPPVDFVELTIEQNSTLQELYRKIVREFHPLTHPDMTQVQKELFQKAQEAYRMKNIQSLELIYQMLCDSQGETISLELMLKLMAVKESDDTEETKQEFTTDYQLVSDIFHCFKATAEETILEGELVQYRQQIDFAEMQIKAMNASFPLSAQEILTDAKELEEFREELSHRLRAATAKREQLAQQIEVMLKGAKAHE